MTKSNPPMANSFNTFLLPSSLLYFSLDASLCLFCKRQYTKPIFIFSLTSQALFLCYNIFSGNMGSLTAAWYSIVGMSPQFTESSFYYCQRIASNLGSTWKIISFEFLIFQMRKLHPLKLAICPRKASWSEARLGPGTPRPCSLLLLASHAASWASARHFLEPNCRALPTFFLSYIL